jgi:membrane associated rhomboid family serine protease
VIPLRDLLPRRHRPWATYSILAINALVWLYELTLDDESLQLLLKRYGVIPTFLISDFHWGSLVTPVTSLFLHASWLHVIGNLWFLHIFGDNVEDELRPGRFLLFYVACGLAAVGAHLLIDPNSELPLIGASGAIAGILAAYLTLYPRARVLTLVPLFVFLHFAEIPAIVFIVLWFGYQILMGLFSLGPSEGGGVAFFAHIGGFLAGLVLIRLMRTKKPPTQGPSQG